MISLTSDSVITLMSSAMFAIPSLNLGIRAPLPAILRILSMCGVAFPRILTSAINIPGVDHFCFLRSGKRPLPPEFGTRSWVQTMRLVVTFLPSGRISLVADISFSKPHSFARRCNAESKCARRDGQPLDAAQENGLIIELGYSRTVAF